MSENKKNILIFILILLIAFLSFNKFDFLNIKTNNLKYIPMQQIKTDTLIIFKEGKKIVLDSVKMKIKYVRDTVIITKPFVAKIDTLIKYDTISIVYHYPENLLSMKLSQKPDSTIIIKQIEYVQKEEEWWKQPALILSGAVIGYFLAK
ncbi:MAG: hypothetical protein ACPL1A_07255 [Candidatus Kapaibacteriota bacterium]